MLKYTSNKEKKAAYLESATPDIDRLVMLFVTIIICNNVWHYGNRFMEMILTKEEVDECSIYRLWKQSTLKEHRKMLGKRKSQWSSKKKKNSDAGSLDRRNTKRRWWEPYLFTGITKIQLQDENCSENFSLCFCCFTLKSCWNSPHSTLIHCILWLRFEWEIN